MQSNKPQMTGQTTPPKTPIVTPDYSRHSRLHAQQVLVVSNPRSGPGTTGPGAGGLSDFVRLLRLRGAVVTERELGRDIAAPDVLRDLGAFQALVAAGGDGTISSLAYASRPHDVPILVYPAGTANLIAQNLDLPRTPRELLDVLERGNAVRVDMGEMEVRGRLNGFCMLAGAGADAAMIRDSEDLKDRFGALAYVLSAMKQINPRKTTFYLTIDGQPRTFEGIAVMIANFGMASYRLPITSDINPSDGQLTLILLRADHLLRLGANLLDSLRIKLNLGDPLFSRNLETLQVREVTVEAAEPFPLQYDGELHLETTPFTARILPGAVRFLTSAQAEGLST